MYIGFKPLSLSKIHQNAEKSPFSKKYILVNTVKAA